MDATAAASPPQIAVLPSPGMGHLIPLLEFAKKLHHHHRITTTFIVPTYGPLSGAQSTFLSNLPNGVSCIILPAVNFDDLPDGVKIETRISLTITRSLPSIRTSVQSLNDKKKLSALIVDLFGSDGIDVATELKIPSYIFFPSNAFALSLFLHLPKLDEAVSSEFWEVKEKFHLPGCTPVHGKDLVLPLQDRKDDAYKWFLHHANRYRMADGIILNSFKGIEPGAIEALQMKESESKNPVVYPIGPLIQNSPISESLPCLNWLDLQPICSVLYVSFGSGGTLSHDQIIELALGLELSEQRFLWVLRCPSDKSPNAAYFNSSNNPDDPLAYLPDGFLDRTKDRGLVVPLWAPQASVLAHTSTGAFLSHCGWNSTLESVVNGVPMIAWPLFAEQRMNAVMLHEDVKVALRVKAGDNGIVGRVEIANVVKCLMEGEEGKKIRSRSRDLKNAATEVYAEDGTSPKLLAELATMWKGRVSM